MQRRAVRSSSPVSWRNLSLSVAACDVERLVELLESLGSSAVTASAAGTSPIVAGASSRVGEGVERRRPGCEAEVGRGAFPPLDVAPQVQFEEDPEEVLEPEPGATPLWTRVRLDALFEERDDLDSVAAVVREWLRARGGAGEPGLEIGSVVDEDWSRTWRRFAAPIEFGGRLTVVPRDWTGGVVGVSLRLDPGLAFGTGTHPTTALCLEWIARQEMGDLSVVDYGCGSGVLGIAALLLGAARVLSVDHDPQARLATVENAAHNGIDVESGRMVVLAPAAVEVARHDVVLANILADPLVALSRTLTSLVRPGGRILLSGLRVAQRDRVVHAYPGFRFEPSELRDGWIALEGTRSSE